MVLRPHVITRRAPALSFVWLRDRAYSLRDDSPWVHSVGRKDAPTSSFTCHPVKPAARLTDLHVCPMVTGLVPHVGGPILPPCHVTTYIAGLPAARMTDNAVCVGPPDVIVSGAPTTMIGGLPAARVGDQTAHGGIITLGCLTVLIGEQGGGAGGGAGAGSAFATLQALTMRMAKRSGAAFCEECAAAAAAPPAPSQTPQAETLRRAKENAMPFCEECQ